MLEDWGVQGREGIKRRKKIGTTVIALKRGGKGVKKTQRGLQYHIRVNGKLNHQGGLVDPNQGLKNHFQI